MSLLTKQKQTHRPRECIVLSKHLLPTTQEMTLLIDHMVSTEIRLIIFFAGEDGEALYT